MKTFNIPVTWTCWALMKIKADNIEEAQDKAMQSSLPLESEYIDDSFQIDGEGLEIHNK